MLEVTAKKTVPAPPDRVWELLSDTSRYAEWVAGTDEVTRSDGPAAVGVTYDEVNPVLGPWKTETHWEVVEHDDAALSSRHTTSDIPLSSTFEVEMSCSAAANGGTDITQTLRGTPSLGPIGSVFAALMKGQVARDNRKSLDQLEDLLRREGAATPTRMRSGGGAASPTSA
jgi:uncharacterized protein YndB with AHSA1/START domain